jgi:DNA-binding NarL/FixJ family response regulator
MTRVVVGEDNYLVLEGILTILAGEPTIDVVGAADDHDSLRKTIEQHRPNVVLADIRMPPSLTDEGIRIAKWLEAEAPRTGLIVLSQYVEVHYVLSLLEHGSEGRGYLLKESVANQKQLVDAIHTVAEGGSVIDPKVVEKLIAAKRSRQASRLAQLSSREIEVLACIARGQSNSAIAASLHLTKGSVEKHINSIFSRLELDDDADVSRRVLVALFYLAETGS